MFVHPDQNEAPASFAEFIEQLDKRPQCRARDITDLCKIKDDVVFARKGGMCADSTIQSIDHHVIEAVAMNRCDHRLRLFFKCDLAGCGNGRPLSGRKNARVQILSATEMWDCRILPRSAYEAATLYRRALQTGRHVFGDENPRVATILHNLVDLLRRKGDDQAAELL